MTYAYARSLDAQTGQWDYTTAFVAATSPALELVTRILRTRRGQCLGDPSMGVNWGAVDPLGTNAAETAEAVIRAGLAPLVSRGDIAGVVIKVTVDGAAGRVLYSVDFTDVRLRTRQTATGTT